MQQQISLPDVCATFECAHADELFARYLELDQLLMHSQGWDYKNEGLETNKIHTMLKRIDRSLIEDEFERGRARELLWLWNHHAISCALWRYGDRAAALEYAKEALSLQSPDHPNKITRLLYLLIRGDIDSAREHVGTIESPVEQETAGQLMKMYSDGTFFDLQV